ncbi:RNA polymerase sigma factor [Alkalihalophilus sp. As8PL]|uniref:RNA polymerase sigma factor n=1 Tax=Alkalihalophilus sp. As8PL TaxID=3237103 RepID=A0AB39BVT1_9BACI
MNVKRLVGKAKKGNKEALLQLIIAQKDDYYRLALTYLGNAHDAMDAMEDMIVKLYEKIDQLQKEDAFYSWSKTILVNHCKALLKKKKKLVLIDDWKMNENEGEPSTIDDPYEQTIHQLELQELLLYLNAHQREAIQLKYFHDFDYETIARITGVPIGTVKSRVSQGLKKMRDHIGGGLDE